MLGWKVDTILAPEDGRYSLKLGPLRIRDLSSILDRVARPTEMIVLYDNESLPRCKRVREIMNLLDLSYECRPCFGADADGIPFIDDPNAGGRISGDNEIIEHLLENYGPPADLFDRKEMWPIMLGGRDLSKIPVTVHESWRVHTGDNHVHTGDSHV